MDKIKKFFAMDYVRRAIAVAIALVITCILCQCAKVNINQSLGVISCAFCSLMLCIFFEERVYHAGSIKEALAKMTYADFIRYGLGLIFDIEILFFFIYGGYVRLSLCIISALVSVIIKLVQKKQAKAKVEAKEEKK